MAIGLGKMLGFNLPRNFDRPYISKSITEFWKRWHISLSTWFKDYLYIPLGGNRVGTIATYRNLFIVFALCGIWHGAGWNFLLWGIYHGSFLIFERSFRNIQIKIHPILAHVYTLLVVLIGWVIFRCESFLQVKFYLLSMAGGSANAVYRPQEIFLPLWFFFLVLACGLSTVKINYEKTVLFQRTSIASGAFYLALLTICTIVLVCGTHNPFIYFRF
jgi:alginate O-acetyltransferase complex protein AlgI